MFSDVPLNTKTQCRVRLGIKPNNLKSAVEYRPHLPEFETGSRRKIEQRDDIRRYHNACPESERRSVLWLADCVCNGRRREKIRSSRIKPPLAVRVYVNRRRKEKINSLTQPPGNHRLKIVSKLLAKIIVALDARVCGQTYGRIFARRDPVIADAGLDHPAQPALTKRRAISRKIKLVSHAISEPE